MSQFSGFPTHIETHIGSVRGADGRAANGRDRGYQLVYCDHTDGAYVSILTSGLRERTAGAPLPQELICTLHANQESQARHLTGAIAELLVESNSRVGYGALIMNDRPLLADTDISGALAAPHPLLSEEFDVVLDDDGNQTLRLITLIPVTRAEAQLVARYGRDVLYDRWEEQGSDLLNIYRASVE